MNPFSKVFPPWLKSLLALEKILLLYKICHQPHSAVLPQSKFSWTKNVSVAIFLDDN